MPNKRYIITVAFVHHLDEISDQVIVSHDNTFSIDDDDIYKYLTKYLNFYIGCDYCQCGKYRIILLLIVIIVC